MARYGIVHRLADFVGRSIPRKTQAEKELFIHKLIELLKFLDRMQEENPSITLTVWAGDGIWVSHGGMRVFLILPRRNGLRILYGMSPKNQSNKLHAALKSAAKDGLSVEDVRMQDDYHLWVMGPDSLSLIEEFVRSLPALDGDVVSKGHPRYFPGAVRQIALEMFERNGRWCPGAQNISRHKVDTTKERIEFDHILPYSKGGSGSALNIQVLCKRCNGIKSATAQ